MVKLLHSNGVPSHRQKRDVVVHSNTPVLERGLHRRRDVRHSGAQHHRRFASDRIVQLEDTQHDTTPEHVSAFGSLQDRLALAQQLQRSFTGPSSESCSLEQLAGPQVLEVTTEEKPSQRTRNKERTPDYFANVGDAIRTLRDDIPSLFARDLNYSIYRDDIVFSDPRNKLEGIKNYKTLFWSLRFHGKLFFSNIYVEIKRIWQPQDDVIKMRWTVHGVPRVPWEAEGLFDGISTYKLDNTGKVYEHQVDNVLLRDPPVVTSPLNLISLNLAPQQGTPCPGAWFMPLVRPYRPADTPAPASHAPPPALPQATATQGRSQRVLDTDTSSDSAQSGLQWPTPALVPVPVTTPTAHLALHRAHSSPQFQGSGLPLSRPHARRHSYPPAPVVTPQQQVPQEQAACNTGAATVVLPGYLPWTSTAVAEPDTQPATALSRAATLTHANSNAGAASSWSTVPAWVRLRAALVASESLLGLSSSGAQEPAADLAAGSLEPSPSR